MSTFISEPGTRLGGRYRLEDRVNASGGWAAWMAIDETLARPVTVLTFAPGFPRIREVVTAARAASRLTDARLAQVFDVEDDWDHAYVVMEWVAGDSLDDLLADGPLDPAHGAEIVAEGAEALAVAHEAGLAHLCLTTDSLRWTPGGGVKVLGLGIDAALSGATAEDPALADTQGLGMLLYAALTCHWPGPDSPTLPPAPLADGRAEVIPAPLAPPPAAPPAAAPRSPDYTGPGMPPGPGPGREYWSPGDQFVGGGGSRPEPRPERPANRGVIAVVAVAVLAAIAIGVWSLGRHPASSPQANAGTSHSAQPSGSGSASAAALTPASAHGFDALGLASDPQNENDGEAKFAVDGDPTTAWHTQFYLNDPVFGGLKKGTGLILDMGKPVQLSQVTITFGPTPGANVSLEVGDNNSVAASTLSTFTTVASAQNVGGTYTFKVTSSAKKRYVLIWFTKLPPLGSGKFEAEIFNVVVRGSG